MRKKPSIQKVKVKSAGLLLAGEAYLPPSWHTLVVLLHGLPLSPPDPSDPGYPALAGAISERGWGSLFVNLRGTGESEGDFCLEGWMEDVANVVEFARREYSSSLEKIILAGFSTGGALAIWYGGKFGRVDGVAAMAAPAYFTDLFKREYMGFFIERAKEIGIIRNEKFPPDIDLFYQNFERIRAIDYVSRISPAPLLLAQGMNDELVPPEHAKRLYSEAGEPKELFMIREGPHGLRHDLRCVKILLDWISRIDSRE
ncbi:MAG: alpha/beta fold hydrolase [Actinomycetota bacterium]|nr:alpha/beta fold hydrolase [Actinomycetota bacterium]